MSDSVQPHRQQPPGSPIPGILQARTLEWVAISFSSAYLRLWIFLPAILIPACASSSPAFLTMYSSSLVLKRGQFCPAGGNVCRPSGLSQLWRKWYQNLRCRTEGCCSISHNVQNSLPPPKQQQKGSLWEIKMLIVLKSIKPALVPFFND